MAEEYIKLPHPTTMALPLAQPPRTPQAALECACPSSQGTTASSHHSPKKHSIDMGSTPVTVKQHQLEWHVTQFVVGSGTGKKSILNSIAGKTRSGELTAILGPSGAGKTTLLECISLRNRNFDGAVHYDDRPPSGEFFTRSVLVHQKELLYGFMTPREHLLFHAIARMSRTHTSKQMHERVEEVLREVKLEKCADTIVGGTDPIYMKKGISGGERKRLCIAAELLLAPQLIFLDEPTSGLDSVMSESIFATMKELTRNKGRIVMASVHTPSSEMCQQFTHVLLLTCDGRLAYHGRQDQAIKYFHGLGYNCPENYNPADFYLKLISATPGALHEEEKARMDRLVVAFKGSDLVRTNPLPEDSAHRHFQMVFGAASSYTLFRINIWRAFIQLRRDWITFILWGIVSAIVGVLFGVLYWQQAAENWRNLVGLLFSVVVASMFTGSMATMMRFPLDWGIVVREYFSGSNAIGPYLVARFIADAPMCYGPFLLITLIYWMTGMDPSFKQFLAFALTFVSGNWAASSLGQFVSSFSSNPFIGMTILPAFVAPMITFSGILYERSSVPVWLGWMQTLSLVNYSFSALMIQQIHILPKPLAAMIMQFVQLNPDDMAWDIAMLWIMNFGFQILTYINLSLRLRFATGN